MSVLLAAVESGSLSKASRKLRLPLATVSRKVAELEAHLNATLLIRSAKGLELTPAGRSYVTGAKAILEQLNEVERAASGEYTEPKGDLVVTAPIMFGRLHVLPVVTRFLEAFPDVAVKLMLTDRVTHFLDDQVDVALRIGDLPDSGLIATRLGTVRRVMCASPDYLAAHGVPTTLAGSGTTRRDLLRQRVRAHHLALRVRWRSKSHATFRVASERQHHRRGDRCRPRRHGADPRRLLSGCRALCAPAAWRSCSKPSSRRRGRCIWSTTGKTACR